MTAKYPWPLLVEPPRRMSHSTYSSAKSLKFGGLERTTFVGQLRRAGTVSKDSLPIDFLLPGYLPDAAFVEAILTLELCAQPVLEHRREIENPPCFSSAYPIRTQKTCAPLSGSEVLGPKVVRDQATAETYRATCDSMQ